MRAAILIAITCFSAAGLCSAEEAAAAIRKPTVIPGQELGSALQTLAAQREMNLMFVSDDVKDLRSAAVSGELTPEEALRLMLHGTGLTYRFLDKKTITILPAILPAAAPAQGAPAAAGNRESTSQAPAEKSTGFWARLFLAQADTSSPSSPGVARRETPAPAESERPVALEEVVVTGTNIRGGAPTGAALQVYDKQAIQRSGYGTVEDFMKSLPVNLGNVGSNTTFVPASTDSFNTGFGSAVNLRGLGTDATLVLLNGNRIAAGGFNGALVDVSFIPLSLIERIEVLTDGASAIYGSDAVAGVVNYILRDDFAGVETGARVGTATRGDYEQASASQAFGRSWSTGNAVLAYNYNWNSDLSGEDRDFSKIMGPRNLIPEVSAQSGFAAITQRVGAVKLHGEAIYSVRDVDQFTLSINDPLSMEISTEQQGVNLSADMALRGDWAGRLAGTWSRNETDLGNRFGAQNAASDAMTLGSRFDGPLLSMPAGELRAAVGAEYRQESIDRYATETFAVSYRSVDRDRSVKALYTELSVPLVSGANAMRGVQRLALTAAARYEEYSDFGNSVDPKLGIAWSPLSGLTVRGTAGTSFKAPRLVDLYGTGQAILVNAPDPQAGPGATSPALIVNGFNEALQPESSFAWTAGLDWTPAALPDLRVTLTYFDISYEDRIASSARQDLFAFISRPERYAPFITRNPSADEIDRLLAGRRFFDTTTQSGFGPPRTIGEVRVIGDQRLNNLSATDVEGVDFDVRYAHRNGAYDWSVGLMGTYLLTKETTLVDGFPPVVEMNTLFNPTDLRFTGSATLRRNAIAATLAVHYTDSYRNVSVVPNVGVDSWTTADLQVRYDFGASFVSLNAINVLDASPPSVPNNGLVSTIAQYGYDAANANPLGRLVSLQLTHQW